MSYAVKEIFKTLQGEGRHAGRAAVFCRFAGCNLWSGREADRPAAVCTFCDTDFVGLNGPLGGRYPNASELAAILAEAWGPDPSSRYAVLTGGEPLLQVDDALTSALHDQGFEVAIETNGSLEAVSGLDWICVSPKAGAPLRQKTGHEIKLVYPQPDLPPEAVSRLEFDHFWLQPMDGPALRKNTAAAVAYCLSNPQWRLSVQTHKMIGIA